MARLPSPLLVPEDGNGKRTRSEKAAERNGLEVIGGGEVVRLRVRSPVGWQVFNRSWTAQAKCL